MEGEFLYGVGGSGGSPSQPRSLVAVVCWLSVADFVARIQFTGDVVCVSISWSINLWRESEHKVGERVGAESVGFDGREKECAGEVNAVCPSVDYTLRK